MSDSTLYLFFGYLFNANYFLRVIFLAVLSCASSLVLAVETPNFVLKNNRWEQLVIPADASDISVRDMLSLIHI